MQACSQGSSRIFFLQIQTRRIAVACTFKRPIAIAIPSCRFPCAIFIDHKITLKIPMAILLGGGYHVSMHFILVVKYICLRMNKLSNNL